LVKKKEEIEQKTKKSK